MRTSMHKWSNVQNTICYSSVLNHWCQGETSCLLSALLSLQPRTQAVSGQTREQAMLIITEQLLQQIPALLPTDTIPSSRSDDSSAPLRTVLLQEVFRYNVLLAKIRSSLINLQKGITV